jgi:hypothetical protein
MTDDDRIHELLGKHLLGRASEDEIRELRARRDADAAFREAMDAAERASRLRTCRTTCARRNSPAGSRAGTGAGSSRPSPPPSPCGRC